MKYPIESRAATIISANEFALALSDEPQDVKIKLDIHNLDMPTLATTVADAARGQKILKELGYSGAYYVKQYNNTDYVIIKGLPSLRPYLKGTRYLTQNPKVVRVGIGPVAGNAAIKANFILAMTMYTATDIAAMVTGDGITFSKLMGNMIFNATSTAVASLAQSVIVAGVGFFTTMAAPAIVSGIVVGVGVSMLLSNLNEELRLSERLAEMLEHAAANFEQGLMKPDIGRAVQCSLPSSMDDFPEFEDCVRKKTANRPGTGGSGTGAGGGTGAGAGSGTGEGSSTATGSSTGTGGGPDEIAPSAPPDFDGPGSYADDNEDYGAADNVDYGGKGGRADGFSMGYRDAATGEWVSPPESDGYYEVITAKPGDKDGSQ